MIGKHLAEHCRAEYPKVTNFILWILAELAVVACDIPEGTKTCKRCILTELQSYLDSVVQPFRHIADDVIL